jgi:hypothetical protein
MRTSPTRSLLLGSFALAVGILLPSCVDPYAQGPGPQHSVTAYRAGYEVRTLPPGYRTEVIDGSNYYNYNGTYYRPHSGRYVVVEAPRRHDSYGSRYDRRDGHRDVVITQLPRGYRTVQRRGVRYYQVNNTYYQQRGSGYVVVNFSN